MKSTLLLAALSLGYMADAAAQQLSFTPALQWGTVTEATTGLSRSVQIANPSDAALRIDSVKTFIAYGQGVGSYGHPFTVAGNAALEVVPHASATVDLGLAPRHNVPHASVALLCGSGLHGCLPVSLSATVNYRKGYYAGTQGLWGQALYTALKTKTGQGYISHSYTQSRDQMFMVIDNKRTNGQGASVNTIECIYTGRQSVGYTSRTDAQTPADTANKNFNTEHTFPQSLFGSTPMESDVHHIFPSDGKANGARADYPFDTVITVGTYSRAGSKLGLNAANQRVFEPRNVQKGRTARAMCYFVTRYEDYRNFMAPQEAQLRRWALHYLPDTVDLKRNADVQAFQANRNPYTDYPQLLERIPSLVNPGQAFPAVVVANTYPPTGTLNLGDTSGYYFTTVNEGNAAVTVTPPAAPAGFEVQTIGSTTIPVGGAVTYKIKAVSAGADTYTFTPAGSSPFTLVLADPSYISRPVWRATLTLSPNPAHGFINVTTTAETISVYDLTGRPLYSGHAGRVDISAWRPGVYLVRADGRTARLIVE